MSFSITYATYTDKGGRAVNEDSVGVFFRGENSCFVLCDGLGGHGMGDIASSLTVEVFEDQFNKTNDGEAFLCKAFLASQDILLAEQKRRRAARKMKTTATALILDESTAYIGHIGDSRVYVFNRSKVKKRTLDHSIPQMLALSRVIKESEIRNHPERNTLLRVLGVEWEEPMYELMSPVPLKKSHSFLLCSDGFWELIEEKTMCELLKKSSSVTEWLEAMAEVVKANGAEREMDNNSAIAVWCR